MSLLVVPVVSVSVIVTINVTINTVLVITTRQIVVGILVGVHGVSVVSVVIAPLELTIVSIVLSISLSFSLSLSLENSVVLAPVLVVLVVSKVRSVVGRHVALGEGGVVVVGPVGSIVAPMAVESWAAVIPLSSTELVGSKIARFSLGIGLRLSQSRNNEKSKYQEFHG